MKITIIQGDIAQLGADLVVKPADEETLLNGGPFGTASRDPKRLLISAYKDNLELADNLGLKNIAFPCIGSGGIYGYSQSIAIELTTFLIKSFRPKNNLCEVLFYGIEERDINLYKMFHFELTRKF